MEVRAEPKEGAKPTYLLDREETNRAKVDNSDSDPQQHPQAKEEREGGKMGCSYSKSEVYERS